MGKREDAFNERNEPVSFEGCKSLRKTARALLVQVEDEELWIPFSVITDDSEVFDINQEGTLIIPRWFAADRGLA